MATTQKVFRSINEFNKHYFPKAYEKELEEEKRRDPKKYGTGLMLDILKSIKKELAKICG